MFICDCGGVMVVVAIEEPPDHLSEKKKLVYNRVCDVESQKCGKVVYSQAYDDGSTINEVKNSKPL
ncbi:hypothetical protein PY093_16500 [Cytobacillus sp. S13-E01]|uniref:hypothetical protein n=1 Tax=Cytobacillus sp. S13-E01 TaxID=3031326 RepID=UPI0023D8B0C1|nr:hypothetical protein [Cytobacillus sp. S13-E01]MDF0728267.1 hypothetical protein [Cytobacillus sp. S13-E01]